MSKPINNTLVHDIKTILHSAKSSVYQTINRTMTKTYWEIGRRIIEEEQGGETRAKYGKALVKNLSLELTREFGKGFSDRNIENMRRFYLAFSKSETVSRKFEEVVWIIWGIIVNHNKQIILSTHDENFHRLLEKKIPTEYFDSKFIEFETFGKVRSY